MFANANRGHLPQTGGGRADDKEPTVIDGVTQNVLVRWFGGLYGTSPQKFHAPSGLLYEYLGTAEVGGCPTFLEMAEHLRPQYGPVCYAYSSILGRHAEWVGPPSAPVRDRTGGVKLTRIRNAAEKALIWDSIRIQTGKLDRTPWGYPTTGWNAKHEPNFHGRHGLNGNVAWADGHCSPYTPYYFDTHNNGGDPAPAQATPRRRHRPRRRPDDGRDVPRGVARAAPEHVQPSRRAAAECSPRRQPRAHDGQGHIRGRVARTIRRRSGDSVLGHTFTTRCRSRLHGAERPGRSAVKARRNASPSSRH